MVARDRIEQGAGPVGLNRQLSQLRALFRWAIDRGHFHRNSPFKRHGEPVEALKKSRENPRERRLQAGEEQRLLAACNPFLHDLVVAAIDTGCRRGELLTLTWRQVTIERGKFRWITVCREHAKTRTGRRIPISARLRGVLGLRANAPDGQPHPPEAFVFGNAVGEAVKSIKTSWRLACRRAGIAGLHFHDLRHDAISSLLDAGGAPHDVRDIAGHADIDQTSIYAQTDDRRLKDAMRKPDERRARLARRAAKKGTTL